MSCRVAPIACSKLGWEHSTYLSRSPSPFASLTLAQTMNMYCTFASSPMMSLIPSSCSKGTTAVSKQAEGVCPSLVQHAHVCLESRYPLCQNSLLASLRYRIPFLSSRFGVKVLKGSLTPSELLRLQSLHRRLRRHHKAI